MKQRLVNLDSIIQALKPYLPQYLAEHGIETTEKKNFKCIDPKHDDENASMHLYGETVHCFGCGSTLNLHQVCSILEGRPSRGKEWIEDNVLYLAKKYNIQVELDDLTPEEIYEYRTYGAYKLAAELVSNKEFGDYKLVKEEIKRRGWNLDKLSSWGIGTVNYDEFRNRLKKAGFEPKLLDGIGLSDATLFSENNLIFTVTDDDGRPVGFSAKRLIEGSGPRYTNTRQTGLECAIFKKGERLYGYDVAKDAPDPLYIFEGQANVITARHHGLMNCCCLMGTALTDHHIALLKKYGSFNIVLALDGDQAGKIATEKAIDEKFSKEKDFMVKLCQLPENSDPDELIRNQGYDAFVRLKRWTAFEWRMAKFINEQTEGEIDDEQREEIANKMIPIIVSEKNYFRQESMAKQVAKMTGYDIALVMAEVKRRRSEEENEIHTKKANLIESLLYSVRKNPDEAEMALTECQRAVENINKSVQTTTEGSYTLNSLQAIKEIDENKSAEFAGFFMKPQGMGGIASRLNEDWRKDTLIYIGGSEQASKSSCVSQMLYEIADDPRNNAICLYFSIDDPGKRIAYKWVCNAVEDMSLQLNWVSSPKYWAKEYGEEILKIRDRGYRKVLRMAKEGRLVLKDASNGTSLASMKNVIRYYRDKFPSENMVVAIDSFHKLSDYSDIQQDSTRTKRLSNDLKEMCASDHITTIGTAEYKKLPAGVHPDNDALSQSKSLSYDSDVIIHLFNEHHFKGESAVYIHEYEENILPRIRCKFGKNKISGYVGLEFLDLFPYHATLRATDLDQVREEKIVREQFLKENSEQIL